MSLLIDGKLQGDWMDTQTEDGEYIRKDSQFRNWITPDGSAGPSGSGGFPAEAGRYHLYISYACPWAHRTMIFRELKQLTKLISFSVVHPHMGAEGWNFGSYPGATGDHLHNMAFMHQLYSLAKPDYTGVVTVPVLWDKQTQTIVNNESSEIIRMLNNAFNSLTGNTDNYYPESLRSEIDEVNDMIYNNINNGVYRCGFAQSQKVYDKAVDRLFSHLERVEERLSGQRYLAGSRITEADWRLFPTLVRFDPVYVTHFKCNRKRLNDFHNLINYTRELYQITGISETYNLDHIKHHYYTSHEAINPTRIIAEGFPVDFTLPHDRERLA